MINEHRFQSNEKLFSALCSTVIDCLNKELENNQPASLLASGGSTPKPLYQALSQVNLDWEKINIALVDERWVETNQPDSNECLLRENLLINLAQESKFFGMKTNDKDPVSAVKECNRRYTSLPSPYTLCILGMGADGHTASLFPNAQGLEAAINSSQYCSAITAIPSATTGKHLQRMTLTANAILNSKRIILLFTGEKKWATYQQAKFTSSPNDLPLAIFLQQEKVDIDVYWAP